MKTDTRGGGHDPIERAHLKDPQDRSHTIHRYLPEPEFAELVGRFWFPVWSVPPGSEAVQRVLQFPVCLMVISAEYSRFYGVVSGVSATTLVGEGWAAGLMLTPAAGFLIAGRSVDEFTDQYVDMAEVLGAAGTELTSRVRALMVQNPNDEASHRAVMAEYVSTLESILPVDDEGRLINEIVSFVESNTDVLRVSHICDRFGMSEKAVQRLVRRRLGLAPKWLIQRRRLHEAAERLRDSSANPAELAFVLGYADQAHFIRDFKKVTAMTPGQYAAQARG